MTPRTRARVTRLAVAVAAALALLAVPRAHAATPDAEAGEHLYVVRWTTRPDQDRLDGSAYTAWSRKALPRGLAGPGIREIRTFRAAVGQPHILTTFAFTSLAALAAWREDPAIARLHDEARRYTYELGTEIWGPSPWLAAPLAPAGRAAPATGTVLYVASWSPAPDPREAYGRWVADALRRWAAGPEVLAVRAYRVLAGTHDDVFVCEFPSLEAWARWFASDDVQALRMESRERVVDARTELWMPNAMLPGPLRPDAR